MSKLSERQWSDLKGVLEVSATKKEALEAYETKTGRRISAKHLDRIVKRRTGGPPSALMAGSLDIPVDWVDSDPITIGYQVKKVSTHVDGEGKVISKWVQSAKDESGNWAEFWKSCEEHAAKYKGTASPLPKPKSLDKNTITVYPLGDPHIGMLAWGRETGEDFDLKIAEAELFRAVDMLVSQAPASETALLVNLGDFFHADDDTQLTPMNKNKLDCDSRHGKIMEVGFALMRRMIDRLLEKHGQVIVFNTPGNHDPRMARVLALWLRAVYEKEKRVEIQDNANPYQYLKFGKVLFGICHGDGAKVDQLPAIMATDRPEDWGQTVYRVWLTGHRHHAETKEKPGCMVETFRTLAPKDAWANWKGYRSGQSLNSITYDAEYGEGTRHTVDIRLVRSKA